MEITEQKAFFNYLTKLSFRLKTIKKFEFKICFMV